MPRSRTRSPQPVVDSGPDAPLEVEAAWDPATFPFRDEDLVLAITRKRWAGTEDAAVVKTQTYKDGLRAIVHAASRRQLVCFYGDPGTGKSLTALSACQALAIRPFYVPIAPARSGKDVEFQILSVVDPGSADPRATRYVMRKAIVKALSAEPSVLLVDEFDLSKGEGLDVLRYLLEQRLAKAGFVILGTNAHKLLRMSPPLDSRCARWVAFEKQAPTDLLPILRAYHPLFAAMPAKALMRIDSEWAHGNFRAWAKFLEAGLRIAGASSGGLTDEQIGLVYALINRPSDRIE